MERWRWLPADIGREHIAVNIPEFRLRICEGGALIHQTRVIVGKTETPTPIFSGVMEYAIVNPSWNVPPSILKNEFLPGLAGDPNYAARRGYAGDPATARSRSASRRASATRSASSSSCSRTSTRSISTTRRAGTCSRRAPRLQPRLRPRRRARSASPMWSWAQALVESRLRSSSARASARSACPNAADAPHLLHDHGG